MLYTINEELNGIEVAFDDKPSEEVRTQLKENGFRWHKKKKLWYAKNTAERVALIEGMAGDSISTEDWGGEHSDGYFGAIRWDGSKSGKHLYGAELSKAIREDLKSHGIKGCTVSVSTYSMGQSITVKVKVREEDFVPYDEWIKDKSVFDFVHYNWIWTGTGRDMRPEEWSNLEDEKQKEEIFKLNAEREYKCDRSGRINDDFLERYTSFKPELTQKIRNIRDCINSYRYDDSNGMVDYFDTNFYYDIELKEVA